MARFEDFDAYEAEQKGERITFKLGGQEWEAVHINAAAFLQLARASATGGDAAIVAFDDYITSILDENRRDAFHRMLVEKDVSLATLRKLGEWIVQQMTGNPTEAVSSSPGRPSKRGQRPRVVSLDGGSRSRTSRSAAS